MLFVDFLFFKDKLRIIQDFPTIFFIYSVFGIKFCKCILAFPATPVLKCL